MNISKATPRPWHSMKTLSDGFYVRDDEEGVLAQIKYSDACAANAALIVQAVNSYEPMLYALRYIQQMADPSHPDPDIVKNVFKVATDAIAIAEGRTS